MIMGVFTVATAILHSDRTLQLLYKYFAAFSEKQILW